MQTLPRYRNTVIVLSGLLLALFAGALALADQPEVKQKKGEDSPAEVAAPAGPSEKVDASAQGQTPDVKAKVTPEARQVIDQVDAAYAKIQKLELGGTFSADLDANGTQRKETKNFTATYAAPNKFRHAMQDDILVGSTGDKAYAYLESNKKFTQADAPKDKPKIEQLPEPIPGVLQMQNPALVLAVAKSAAAELMTTFTDITKVEDSKLAGEQAAYPTLRLTLPNKMIVTMLFHPETHLLRQSRTDIKPMLEERGTPDVKNASLVVDYTTVKVNETAGVKDEQFAWAPPEGARDQAEAPADGPGAVADAGEASVLEGKPAPAFAIKDLEGKTVSLKDLKGKVVVLDMWATWCPPCRASLPHLDKLYGEVKDKGVTIYAVNLQEEKDDVQNFIKQTNLKVPVLLDKDGAVAQAYKANAIPQTIVIDKAGNVAKVFVGFSADESPQKLKDAVDKAMK